MARKKKEIEEVEIPESTVVEEETQKEPEMSEEDQREARIMQCNQELSQVLQKYGCALEPEVLLRAGQVIPQIRIIPVELLPRTQPQPTQQ
jgi:hypothetical protein